MGFCSRVVSTTTNPDRQEAHNGHFSTFTTDTEQPFQDNPPAIELYYCCHVCNHRTSNDARTVSLDGKRWQLPNDPAFLLHCHSLGAGFLGLLLRALAGSERQLSVGR